MLVSSKLCYLMNICKMKCHKIDTSPHFSCRESKQWISVNLFSWRFDNQIHETIINIFIQLHNLTQSTAE